jgi:hypothetical protein
LLLLHPCSRRGRRLLQHRPHHPLLTHLLLNNLTSTDGGHLLLLLHGHAWK